MLRSYIETKVKSALQSLGYIADDALVTISNRSDLSDYQSNIAMNLAKSLHKPPRVIANEIKEILSSDQNFKTVTVDGPGFINISFTDKYLTVLPVIYTFSNKKVIIDYGGPNIAKEMHVGHLRSAIIGESLKRICRFCGDKVIGDVHFGDWGTPIGMLITQLRREQADIFLSESSMENFEMNISEISALYRRASANFKSDDEFKEQARHATFELQKGNKIYRILWKMFRDKSVAAVKKNYDRLDVSFDVWLGESDTNDLLDWIVDDLLKRNIAIHSEGAVIVPISAENDADQKAPLILQKSDGAYTYAITDIATILQRQKDFAPDVILYVVDARQSEHFQQVFEVVRRAGYVSNNLSLEHIAFGTVNGKDGKPFKTRDGGVMNLNDLIDLSEQKARENTNCETEEDKLRVRQVAIGSLKFQDLKNVRTSNYIFDTDNFTKSEGKTGAYIQYAIARIGSVFEKSECNYDTAENADIIITHPFERNILLQLHRAEEFLISSYNMREPSILCDYIYSLAQKFSAFYAELSINNEPDEAVRNSRLKMAKQVKDTLYWGLDLLGIQAPDRMTGVNQQRHQQE